MTTTSKSLYFSKSDIKLRKKFSVLRRLATPVVDGVELASDRTFTGSGWTAGTGITIQTSRSRALF